MRTGLVVAALWLAVGCSSGEGPPPEAPLTDAELGAMPRITLKEVEEKLQGPLEKPLVIALWRAKTEQAEAFLNELSKLAERHADAGLEVLVLNIDFPAELRQSALGLIARVERKFEARAYQDDLMGLGAQVGWGGEPAPVVAVFGRDGKRIATTRGKDALAQIAPEVSAALAAGQE